MGAEIGSNRTLLESAGVTAMGVSYARLVKRGLPKTKPWLIAERFDDTVQVVAYPGVSETKNMSASELETFAADYQDWIVQNFDRLDGFVEFDPPQLGPEWVRQQRSFWVDAGDKFWPVWNPDLGHQDLMALSQDFSDIAITGSAIDDQSGLAGRTQAISGTQGTRWHGIAVASPDNLRQVPLTTAGTLSWASPMMRGETIVWDGTSLKRYPKKMKEQARSRYRHVVESAGLDYDAIVADDAKETTRLAIWSYQRMEEQMNRKHNRPFDVIDGGNEVDNSETVGTDIAGMLFGDVDNSDPEVSNPQSRVPAPRTASERSFLPVLGVDTTTVVETSEDGRETLKDVPVLSSRSESLRQCNTCFVAANCPAFKPDSECAFSLPVEIKTKDQLKALLNAVVEMQGSRVAFARFSEELNGGYPDPNVSQEIDRLFDLVEQMKKLEDNKEFVRMTFERQGGAGVLSSIFGDRAQVLKELDGGAMGEDESNQILKKGLES